MTEVRKEIRVAVSIGDNYSQILVSVPVVLTFPNRKLPRNFVVMMSSTILERQSTLSMGSSGFRLQLMVM